MLKSNVTLYSQVIFLRKALKYIHYNVVVYVFMYIYIFGIKYSHFIPIYLRFIFKLYSQLFY